ncbi:transcriptional regulator, MerR family [Lachnospiraceae bacterium KM106-2]|nr:transcriptional regulator, MerR family [Lachnospiraceae bacterium KM106-2]
MELKINEVAKLSGVTVRTLHYYDQIDLLKPSKITEAGYRLYEEDSLEKLQQILFFRELDFSLQEIKEIIKNPAYDEQEAMRKQKELLIQKRERLNGLIDLIDSAIKGDKNMGLKAFDRSQIEETKKKYAAEVKERWGQSDAYRESEEKTSSYDDKQWEFVHGEGAKLLKEFGDKRELLPESEEAQNLVRRWQEYITKSFYHCTDEILAGLGLMYVGDERFTKNIDQNGEGTAAFMSKAIEIYCSKQKQ